MQSQQFSKLSVPRGTFPKLHRFALEFVQEQAQPRRTIYLSGSGKSGLKRLLAIRPKIVPRGFCKPRGDLNQDSTRKESAEGSTWNWLRWESRSAFCSGDVLW